MQLHHACIGGYDRRDDGTLEWSRGGNHVPGVDHAFRGFHDEAGTTRIPFHLRHFNAAAYGRTDPLRVGKKVVSDLFLGRKGFGIDVGKFQAGKPIVPGRSIGNE